jgi:hypothetical protein
VQPEPTTPATAAIRSVTASWSCQPCSAGRNAGDIRTSAQARCRHGDARGPA